MKSFVAIIMSFCLVAGCFAAPVSTPASDAISIRKVEKFRGVRTKQAEDATEAMLQGLRDADPASYERAIDALTKAYLAYPYDPRTTFDLGFSHLWVYAERDLANPNLRDSEHAILASHYFEKALVQAPTHPRIQGLAGAALIHMARFDLDEAEGKQAIGKIRSAPYNLFNVFIEAYNFSNEPLGSELFEHALSKHWEGFNSCFEGEKPDAAHPDITHFNYDSLHKECKNTHNAAHNLEGFMLNFGDLLTKNGDLEIAKIIYKGAQLSPAYGDWPFKKTLEERINNMEANSVYFKQDPANLSKTRQMLINSQVGCAICHKTSKTPTMLD